MKIAFVGKGGSGKSTLTTLFLRHLQQNAQREILAIDADINMNLAGLLGVTLDPETLLSRPAHAEALRDHLRGSNKRIASAAKFLPTTPPGIGSNVITTANDPALSSTATKVSTDPLLNLLTVGTYDREGIGQSCYHSNLFVAENLLSHIFTNDQFCVVSDMVAGTDAFAYSLHLQFDAIILIAEPTPESAEVCALYTSLARDSGIDGLVHIVGNKIEDEDDIAFITARTGRAPLGTLPVMKSLKKARQTGAPLNASLLTPEIATLMDKIIAAAQSPAINEAQRREKLNALHATLNKKSWVQQGYGDVLNQIDPDFKWENAV